MEDKLIVEDITYGTIEIEDVYKRLVETKAFSRLKEITQTGNAYYTYPDLIDIKRYNHSIGAYYTMCKMIDHLELELKQYNLQFTDEEKHIAKVSMLLHDLGHAVYSHTSERVTREFLEKESRHEDIEKYSHEMRTIDLIKDKDGEICKILTEKWGTEFVDKVVNYLEAAYSEKKLKTEDGQIGLLKVLLTLTSNNLDADRLDFVDKDSKSSGCKSATDIDEIIKSFRLTLIDDEIKIAIPEDRVYLVETMLFERARNYNNIYYSKDSIAGDFILRGLIKKIIENNELSEDTPIHLRKFLGNPTDYISNDEFLELTDVTVEEELKGISERTKNETIRYLCDMQTASKDFVLLHTNESKEYIKQLLKAEIPELDVENTSALIDETRVIKTYKSDDDENINVLTPYGVIKDLRDCYTLVNLEPRTKRYIAINPELIRLELGLSKELFERDYKHKVDATIRTFNKPEEKFELKYVFIGNLLISADGIVEKLKSSGYEIISDTTFTSKDVYYDDITNLTLAKKERLLRTRKGIVMFRDGSVLNERGAKSIRVTYKETGTNERYSTKMPKEKIIKKEDVIDKYKEIIEILRKMGMSENELSIDSEFVKNNYHESFGRYDESDYESLKMIEQILKVNGINLKNLEEILTIHNLRQVRSIRIGKAEVEISVNEAYAVNNIYDNCPTNFATLEITPKNPSDRLAVIEIDKFITENVPDLNRCVTTKSGYELALMHTYITYKSGFFISEDAKEADRLYGKSFAEMYNQKIGDREYQISLEYIKQREEKKAAAKKQWDDFFEGK